MKKYFLQERLDDKDEDSWYSNLKIKSRIQDAKLKNNGELKKLLEKLGEVKEVFVKPTRIIVKIKTHIPTISINNEAEISYYNGKSSYPNRVIIGINLTGTHYSNDLLDISKFLKKQEEILEKINWYANLEEL